MGTAVREGNGRAAGATETARLRNRLRRWRAERGLTLEEIADLTGLSISMISLVERGQRNLAPMSKVQVARRLGTSVSDLFEVEPLPEDAA